MNCVPAESSYPCGESAKLLQGEAKRCLAALGESAAGGRLWEAYKAAAAQNSAEDVQPATPVSAALVVSSHILTGSPCKSPALYISLKTLSLSRASVWRPKPMAASCSRFSATQRFPNCSCNFDPELSLPGSHELEGGCDATGHTADAGQLPV